MKKGLFYILSSALVFTACSSDETDVNVEAASAVKTTEVEVACDAPVLSEDGATRTYYNESDKTVYWNNDDKLAVLPSNSQGLMTTGVWTSSAYAGKYGFDYKISELYGGGKAKFKGDLITSSNTNYIYAVYPYSDDVYVQKVASEFGGQRQVVIPFPAEQTAVDKSWGKGAAVSVAAAKISSEYQTNKTLVSKTIDLRFNIVTSFIYFQSPVAATKVVFAANDGMNVAGEYKVSNLDQVAKGTGSPVVEILDNENAKKEITLTGDIKANTKYYISIPSITFAAGFSLTFYGADGDVYVFRSSAAKTFVQTKMTSIGTPIANWTFHAVDLGLPSGSLWATCNEGTTIKSGEYAAGNQYAWEAAVTAGSNWGSAWSLPTDDHLTELIKYTEASVVSDGIKLQSKANAEKYIILPRNKYIWTSTTRPTNSAQAFGLRAASADLGATVHKAYNKTTEMGVRPIIAQPVDPADLGSTLEPFTIK